MLKEKTQNIINWLGEQTKTNNKSSLIIHWNETVSSSLCIKLALESQKINNIKIYCLFFGSALVLDTLEKKSNKLFPGCILKGVPTPNFYNGETISSSSDNQKFNFEDMCIQNILFHYADVYNGLVVSSINKTSHAERNYFKYGDGLADIFPLLNLYYSECSQILDTLIPNHDVFNDYEQTIAYNLEWAIKENEKTGILEAEQTPDKNNNWFRYTKRQKDVLGYLHQRWKKTQHKKNLHPFPT